MPDTPDARTDREALRELVDTYAFTMDDRDTETLNGLFVPDGRVLITTPGTTRQFSVGAGLEQIITYMAAYAQTFYFVGNHTCRVDGNHATGRAYTLAFHHEECADGGHRVIENAVRYRDSYVRTGEGWRFAERSATILWTADRTLVAS